MLQHLHIRNFAIIDELELDFSHGMTAITGETGAGKSIAIDALGLALGDRADPSQVKHNAKRSEIIASFTLQTLSKAQRWLKEQELDETNECILRRTISAEGGSRAYINGRPVTLQQIKTLSEFIIDIHSQHQHQSLMRHETQQQILDNYGKNQNLCAQVADEFHQWNQLNKKLKQLQSNISERASRIDFLQYQLNEFDELDIKANEWESLESEHKQLANNEQIQTGLNETSQLLAEGDNSASNQITSAIQTLSSLTNYLPNLANSIEALESANINIDETINEIRHLSSDESFDPEYFTKVDNRLTELLTLARKHHCEPDKLSQTKERLEAELNPLVNAEQTLGSLEADIEAAFQKYTETANKLSLARVKSGKKLKRACEKILVSLGMNCQLNVTLDPHAPSATGNEVVIFTLCTNPGAPAKPLNKIASGGELSRISLAIQVVTAQITNISTLIFDEVDVGIGGGVAEVVGNLLKELGSTKQIICITHQAQVAAKSDQHWLVEKTLNKKSVTTRILPLEKNEREIEIARMIGGIELTEATQKHAKEMLGHE